MPKTFLSAKWRNLAMANYVVPPEILKDFVPAGTELDLFHGRCYVSLVGFMFLKTKLLGLPIPFHQNFEEVNLRFYVRKKNAEGWVRGVVFIKEIVPRWAIAFVARQVYREPYVTMKMSNFIKITEGGVEQLKTQNSALKVVKYTWGNHAISLKTTAESLPIAEGSEEEFITEHYFGYTRWDSETTKEYEVQHPRWFVNPVLDYEINCDFGGLYGERFAYLKDEKPYSVLLAEGSEITVMMNKGV
jgi:uncharacterized protein